MMRRKPVLACITERCCILAANVCTGMEINKCMQIECGAIRKSTVRTKPTTSSADRTTLLRGEWTSGADGICTTQPSVNMEIVPAQQPARVVRKAHVFDEVADVWREILEVVAMPVSEPEAPHIPPPDFVPKKEMSCKTCDIKFLNFGSNTKLLCTT